MADFTPRLTSDGMLNNPYWYADNPFYQAGYGLPNCTCYAWGRWYEITGKSPDKLPLGDAKTWYADAQANGLSVGGVPQLGAILCTYYDNGGHVAVVEEIRGNEITISNSGYPSTYFWIEDLQPPYLAPWTPSGAYVQGFIYLADSPIPPVPTNGRKMPFIYYMKRRAKQWQY
mgnify:CR=1 FL=1